MQQLEKAIGILYYLRLYTGLEEGIVTGIGWKVYPKEEYAACSAETKSTFAKTYLEYNLAYN